MDQQGIPLPPLALPRRGHVFPCLRGRRGAQCRAGGAGAAAGGARIRDAGAGDRLGSRGAGSELQNLIDGSSPGEARALADSLRTSVLEPSAAHSLRRRGAAMIKQTYMQEGDKDALLSFTQDEVFLPEGALIDAARDNPTALR